MSSEIYSAYTILSWIYVYLKIFVLCDVRCDNTLVYIYDILPF